MFPHHNAKGDKYFYELLTRLFQVPDFSLLSKNQLIKAKRYDF